MPVLVAGQNACKYTRVVPAASSRTWISIHWTSVRRLSPTQGGQTPAQRASLLL